MSPITSVAATCGQANSPFAVNYHQQNLDSGGKLYCGAASAQMILDSIGAGLLDQDDLYDCSHNFGFSVTEDWHAAPDGLEHTLQTRTPNTFAGFLQMNELTSEEAISRKICWSIFHYGVAPIVLVYRDQHWVVVTGFDASPDPVNSNDTVYTIQGFYLHDPAPPRGTSESPPPHGNCDDGCAAGLFGGTPHQFVTFQDWQLNYLAPVVGGNWDQKYVIICDSDPPAATQDTPPEVEEGFIDDTDEILNRAVQGLSRFNLVNQAPWSSVLPPEPPPPHEQASPGQPVLVERVDADPSWFYYIVPFHLNDRVPLLVKVGASQNGSFAGSIAAPEGGTTHFSRAFDRNAVADAFDGRRVAIGDQAVKLHATDLDEHLVWKPCAESLSPYRPFYQFNVGGPDSKVKAYVRIDGALFTELHGGNRMS